MPEIVVSGLTEFRTGLIEVIDVALYSDPVGKLCRLTRMVEQVPLNARVYDTWEVGLFDYLVGSWKISRIRSVPSAVVLFPGKLTFRLFAHLARCNCWSPRPEESTWKISENNKRKEKLVYCRHESPSEHIWTMFIFVLFIRCTLEVQVQLPLAKSGCFCFYRTWEIEMSAAIVVVTFNPFDVTKGYSASEGCISQKIWSSVTEHIKRHPKF